MYRLTVKTLSDGLETQFTPPDTKQTGPSCLVWLAAWIGHNTPTAPTVRDTESEINE